MRPLKELAAQLLGLRIDSLLIQSYDLSLLEHPTAPDKHTVNAPVTGRINQGIGKVQERPPFRMVPIEEDEIRLLSRLNGSDLLLHKQSLCGP